MQGPHISPARALVRPFAYALPGSLALAFLIRQPDSLRWAVGGSTLPAFTFGFGLTTAVLSIVATKFRVGPLVDGHVIAQWSVEGGQWKALAQRQREETAGQQRLMVWVGVPCLVFMFALFGSGEQSREPD